MLKSIITLSALGGLRPRDPLTRGFALGRYWGHSPQTYYG